MKVITRVAPSITGKLHLGTLFNALVNYIFAKQHHNGVCFLRLDGQHLTGPRIRFQRELLEDLEVFGFKFDFIVKQSDRTKLYRSRMEKLLKRKDVYFCDCSKKDITKRGNNNLNMYSLERAEKYPSPCGIKQVVVYGHKRDHNLVFSAKVSASTEAKGFPIDSIVTDKSSCWQPFNVGYFGDIKPSIEFKWDNPTWVQCIKIYWQNYPLKRYKVFADSREIVDIRKTDSYCYTSNYSHYGDNFKDEISFSPVECTSLTIEPVEYLKEVKIEYYYDQYCRSRQLSLDLDNKKTVIRRECNNFLDIALYFNKQPDLCLTSAIDDQDFGVTHSIRGIDIQPFSLLERKAGYLIGYSTNNLFHSMLLNKRDYKLSKSLGSKPAIAYLKYLEPDTLLSLLAHKSGLVDDNKIRSLPQLIKDSNLDKVFIA